MSDLRKFTVDYNEKREQWELTNDQTDRVVARFDTKSELKAGGVLEDALGTQGGSVKIQLMNGRYEEERTYPRSKDPSGSRG